MHSGLPEVGDPYNRMDFHVSFLTCISWLFIFIFGYTSFSDNSTSINTVNTSFARTSNSASSGTSWMNSSAKSSCDIRCDHRPAGHCAGSVAGPKLGRFKECGSYFLCSFSTAQRRQSVCSNVQIKSFLTKCEPSGPLWRHWNHPPSLDVTIKHQPLAVRFVLAWGEINPTAVRCKAPVLWTFNFFFAMP